MPALEAVIANHLEAQIPIILEGDFILPELAAQRSFGELLNDGSVKAVFLIELDEMQLLQNFSQREPLSGEQTRRARVSWLYNQWLLRESHRVGLPTIAARPWDDVIERVLFAIH